MGTGGERIVDADRPGLTVVFQPADGNIAAGVHQRRSEAGKAPERLVGSPALGDAAQVKMDGVGQDQAAGGNIPDDDTGWVWHSPALQKKDPFAMAGRDSNERS